METKTVTVGGHEWKLAPLSGGSHIELFPQVVNAGNDTVADLVAQVAVISHSLARARGCSAPYAQEVLEPIQLHVKYTLSLFEIPTLCLEVYKLTNPEGME
jgi:hypothetical protein